MQRYINGLNLQTNNIKIAEPIVKTSFEIGESPRIGISKAVELKRRFYIKNNLYLSRNEK